MSEITTQALQVGTWNIDPSHSEVAFTIRHLMSKVRGTFTDVTGVIETRSDNPADASVRAQIAMASVDTRNATRDEHLRSSEIFNVDANPQMTFVSTGISGDEDGWTITGDLTINGVTRSVDLAAEFLGVAADAYGAVRLGAEGSTTINRKDFGVDFNIPLDGGKVLLGDKVDIQITLEAVAA